jgi:diphthine-ammonia ligase
MKFVALVSGGKDSCFNILKCQTYGHELVALANLFPEEALPDDLDSYCFQTVGHQILPLYTQCMNVPLYRKTFQGLSCARDLQYTETNGDEVEDLFTLLAFVLSKHPDVQAVSSGAIASDYQRLRLEHVCSRLGLVSLAYLWHQPQVTLLKVRLQPSSAQHRPSAAAAQNFLSHQ